MPYVKPMPAYYVHTLPGLERIAWDEAQARLPGAASQGFKKVYRRNGLALLAYDGPAEDLLKLRTAEDVFAVAAQMPVAWGYQGFSETYEALVKGRWLRPLSPHLAARGLGHPQARIAFRLVTRLSGPQQPYNRSDLERSISRAIEKATKGRWQAADDRAQVELWANLIGREFLLGLRLSDPTMRHRDYKVAHLPASLRPSAAAAMVWLSRPEADDVLLDPFCGAGTIVIERALMGRYRLLLGGDLDADALAAAAENIGPRHKPRQLLHWDAQALPLDARSVNVVVSNLPFGVQIGDPALVRALYPAAVTEIARVLAPGGRAVLLASEEELLQSALARYPALVVDRHYPVDLLGQPASIVVAHRTR